MSRLRLNAKAVSIDDMVLAVEPDDDARPAAGQVLVAVHAAAVNPSDVKAGLGAMAHAAWPRTPGRDWAGVVLEGPPGLVGSEVFGSGGDLGITRDGSHAARLLLPENAVVPRPASLTMAEAGAIGVPFVTVQEGFHRSGMPQPGDVVLVLAANGRVGQAAVQIAAMLGARVFGAARGTSAFAGPQHVPVTMIDSTAQDVAARLREANGGRGADIVFNTVGSPYFAAGNAAMAIGGRHILISTTERSVAFDIFAFYRGRHMFAGVDTLALDSRHSAAALRALLPGFVGGALRPFPVKDGACYPMDRAKDAYRRVLEGSAERVVLLP